MTTHSSTCIRTVWSSRVNTLRDFTTLCWDSSNEMLCISYSSWSPRISMPSWSSKTFSSSRCIEVGESTSLWWGMRSISYSNSCCSMSASNCLSFYSISCAKSCPYNASPYSPDANYSDESTTWMSATSSICTWCAPFCMCFCCAFISCLWNSCSFQSCSLSSCNYFFASSILFLSFCLHVIRLLCCCLFGSIAITAFSTSGYAWNLQLFSSSMQLKIFLFPLSCTCMLGSAATTTIVGALRDAASHYFDNHSTVNLTGSLGLEKL